MLEKTFQPAAIEPRIAAEWNKAQAFKAGRQSQAGGVNGAPYCIVIPPPNVTGSLHMGHALNNTLQDVLIRFERMRGKDVLWQPGTDHAGIATQMVVERELAKNKQPGRRELGREKFLEKVWAWKAESGGQIVHQLKRLGASCDWSRERFTMDEGLSKAVVKVFVELHKKGLIYKDKRLVNWDPKFQTAISDLEVIPTEVKGHLWHFRYPLKGITFNAEDSNTFIVVATTRPETMLGDTAVAVHPAEGPYKHLIGKTVVLPLVNRDIPIIGDDYADPEKGSGAVKITPAHDFNDFEVGKRHNLPQINVLDAFGKIAGTQTPYDGLDRFEARKRIVADFEAQGLLEKIEDHLHTVPHGDRSGVPVEPWLTEQWYCNAAELAKPAMAAVRDGRTEFVPKNWEKTYFEWMENIQPWCISRQLWWGHQIPAWYGPDGHFFVEASEADAAAAAKAHYKKDVALTRDPDVLDTWFSSALWPFSTLGWPDKTAELDRYYPTAVLVTGRDIIFFWVARMMMMGMHFMDGEVPFKKIAIHGLVLDEKGQKMSKSKGNVMDPLGLIDQYGADALRFTMAALSTQGRDMKLSTQRVEGYRNFATKLWNAARFAEMNECVRAKDFKPASIKEPINRWIAGETERAVNAVTNALEANRPNDAATAVYEFTWGIFCDWYLELIKSLLASEDEGEKQETRATVAWVLDQILKMLHPFMPFLTEELWAHMVEHGVARENLLCLSQWPTLDGLADPRIDDEIGFVVALISEIRSVRQEMNIPAGAKVPLVLVGADKALQDRCNRHEETIARMARLDGITFAKAVPKAAAVIVVGETTAAIPLAGLIDMAAEKKRLEKDIAANQSDIAKMDAKLENPNFVSRAKPEAIEEARERKAELEGQVKRLTAALKRLG
ncbi:MAG: valine--tRNA ligase [Hyphomicrobiaceae bacterium]